MITRLEPARACGRRALPFVALLLLVPGLLGVSRPAGLGDVKDVRTWSYPNYTRVVVEVTRPIEVPDEGLIRLAADKRAKRPERLYVDLPKIWVGRRYVDGVPVGDGLLKAVRLGQNTLTTSRAVIDLEHYDHHRMFTLESPHRVVIDVYGTPDDAAGSAPNRTAQTQRKGARRRLSVESRPVRTVVIDPGHGGKDPGAIGVGGVREKDINLRLARLLEGRLRSRSFRVVMTRDDDRFIDLEERTVIAESAEGDVFVSIHANASRRKSLRGIEIYHLDKDHRRHNLNVAARESGLEPGQVDSLQRTLSRLRVGEVSNHSRALAGYVHEDLMSGLAVTYRGVPDLGVKRGPFYVLFMSSMPAILIETGFITNKKDAKLLRSDRYLDTVAKQIAAGIGHYRNHTSQLTADAKDRDSKLPPVGAR